MLIKDNNKKILDSIVDSYTEGDREQETDKELIKDILIRQQKAIQTI